MKLSLVVCTYMRPKRLLKLLKSVETQIQLPNEVIIVDGSLDLETKLILEGSYINLPIKYFKVGDDDRGLTKQRNYGVSKVSEECDLISFLDDDIILDPEYFHEVVKSFRIEPMPVGVGGIDMETNTYFLKDHSKDYSNYFYFEFDGWMKKESQRDLLRKFLGLMPRIQPDIVPDYSHGRHGLPPTGKTYKVDHFMGGIATYNRALFEKVSFSEYFQGYGLYEDFDFCIRAMKYGDLYVNTKAHVWHHHEAAGRPNSFEYGRMVIRNGWYVWRQCHPAPSGKARIKWHAVSLLLVVVRILNALRGPKRKEALRDSLGRISGWLSLFISSPKIEN